LNSDAELLFISAHLAVPHEEFDVRATTGGGPGGQHVNRSATRIELRWQPAQSASLRAALGDAHHERVLQRLSGRLDASGTMRLVSAEHRSQRRNRDAAMERLAAIIRAALPDPVPRKATKPTRGAIERRLDDKKRRASVKRERGRRDHDG
jgi:ribosome-associated protein